MNKCICGTIGAKGVQDVPANDFNEMSLASLWFFVLIINDTLAVVV